MALCVGLGKCTPENRRVAFGSAVLPVVAEGHNKSFPFLGILTGPEEVEVDTLDFLALGWSSVEDTLTVSVSLAAVVLSSAGGAAEEAALFLGRLRGLVVVSTMPRPACICLKARFRFWSACLR